MKLKSRDDLRIALIDAMAEQGKDKLDIMVLADIDEPRMLRDTRYHIAQTNGNKWRVSWDRILSWITACGYEVHIELRKKGEKHVTRSYDPTKLTIVGNRIVPREYADAVVREKSREQASRFSIPKPRGCGRCLSTAQCISTGTCRANLVTAGR